MTTLVCGALILVGMGFLLPGKADIVWAAGAGLLVASAIITLAPLARRSTPLRRRCGHAVIGGTGAAGAVALLAAGCDPSLTAMASLAALLLAWVFTPTVARS